MRPWVRCSSRTCPRPHRAPVSHSGRGHRPDQAGCPAAAVGAAASGNLKAGGEVDPNPTGTMSAAPRRAAGAPSYRRTRMASRSFAAPKVPRRWRSVRSGSMWCLPRVRRTRATCACFTDPPHMVRKLLGPHGGQRSINRSPGAVRAISAHHATLKRAIRSKNDRRASKPRCRLCVVHTTCPSITWRQWRSACAVNIPRGENGPSRGQPEEG